MTCSMTLHDMCQSLNNTAYYATMENTHTAASVVFRQLSRKAVQLGIFDQAKHFLKRRLLYGCGID